MTPGRSLVDWEMSSDRNTGQRLGCTLESLVDWEMSSDRNYKYPTLTL